MFYIHRAFAYLKNVFEIANELGVKRKLFRFVIYINRYYYPFE